MKRKRVLPLLTALTAGSLVLLSGCNVDVTNINEEEVPIEVEAEEEDLAEGMVLFHSVWYDANGNKLPDVNVAFYEDETLVFSGTTDENGDMESFSLPSNASLFCSVTDEAGNPIAETDLAIKLSDRYDTLSIYPAQVEDSEEKSSVLTLAIPTDRVNLRAAFYVAETESVSVASLTPYSEAAAAEEESEETTEEQSAEEQPAEEQPAEEQPAEEQPAEEQPAEEQPAEEQPAEE